MSGRAQRVGPAPRITPATPPSTARSADTVKVTIARLRRKLGEPEAIRTTPGIGYRIIDES